MYVRPALHIEAPKATSAPPGEPAPAGPVSASTGAEPTTFGVSGKLWRDSVILYDRQTLSLWSQVDGMAKAGPSAGQRLRELPSQITTWAEWRRRHPSTEVLVKPALDSTPYANYRAEAEWVGLPWTRGGRDGRLAAKELVLGIQPPGEDAATAAIPLDRLEGASVVQGELAGLPLVALGPGDARASQVFDRRLDGRILDFELDPSLGDGDGRARDRQTGSTWDPETGRAVSGPLAGKALEPVKSTPVYWATWTAFHPETALWTAPDSER